MGFHGRVNDRGAPVVPGSWWARSLLLVVGTAAAVTAFVPWTGVRAEGPGSDYELGEIFVIGSRRAVRSPADTLAPVDLIAGEDLLDQARGDTADQLRTLIPSYNVSTQPISEAATLVRPVHLRGLTPDQTLVFVNGKRRHRAAPIQFSAGSSTALGTQGADVSVIPAVALDRVEILRDSASAQYGSDAIAGVINLVLKDRPDGGVVETQWGRTYAGDGDEYQVSGNVGLPLGGSGFANLSAEWRQAGPTSRSVQRDDVAALVAAGNPHVRRPHAQVWGSPDISDDWKLLFNLGIERPGGATVYAFGNHARRVGTGGWFFRHPDTRRGVYVSSSGDRLVHDRDSGDDVDCAALPDPLPLAATEACFEFRHLLPGGFTPQFTGTTSDVAGTFGVRGMLGGDGSYDLSFAAGRNRFEYFVADTVNPSLLWATPTAFDLGAYVQTGQVANLDLSWPVEVAAFASPLFAAAGAEWRRESFAIEVGDDASWEPGPGVAQGFDVGANGFQGFSPVSAGEWSQSSYGVYLDLEADVRPDLTLAVRGRAERHDAFGGTTDLKTSILYRLTDGFGVRGAVGTGFRAPTVGQQNVRKTSTILTDGRLREDATIPPTCPEAVLLGGQPLGPEESLTVTGGLVAGVGPLTLTADYFAIDLRDRLALSKPQGFSEADRAAVGASGCLPAGQVERVRYFGNFTRTRTRGVDLVADVDVPAATAILGGGETAFVFAGNWTATQVVEHDPAALGEREIVEIEDGFPRYRFNATVRHRRERWSGYVRLNYFGPYTEFHGGVTRRFRPGAEVTLDVEASYRTPAGLVLSVGAENLLDAYPDVNPWARVWGAKYPESSPMGFRGGFYYARVRYAF